jgi:hypothetical protein
MGRRSSARLAVLVAAAVAGCNMITGVDQLERVDLGGPSGPEPDASQTGPLPDAGVFSDARAHDFQDASVPLDATPTPFDAGGGADAGATVCQGLTTLWRFENKATSSQGDAPSNNPSINYGTGKFGSALQLPNSNQDLEYNAQRGGTPIVLAAQGTVSMWIKNVNGQWTYPCHQDHLFFGLDQDGIYTGCGDPGVLGLWLDTSQTTSVGASLVAQNGEWTSGYNHLVATWSQSPASMGVVFNAIITNTTTTSWTPPRPSITTFYLSAPNAPMSVFLDDVAIWNRPLTNAEIATIYGVGKSIGDVCGLP